MRWARTPKYISPGPAGLFVALLHAPKASTLVPVGRADRALDPPRSRQAHEVEHCLFLRRGRRRHIVIQAPGVGLGDVPISERDDAHALPAAKRPSDLDHVSRFDLAMRLRRLAIEIDLAPTTRPLRLGSRLEQTRDVEPDVEAEGVRSVFHRNKPKGDRSALARPVPLRAISVENRSDPLTIHA